MAQASNDRALAHLPPFAARLGHALARPKVAAVACLVVLVALGWLYLALMLAGMVGAGGEAGTLGPGMGVLDWSARALGVGDFGRSVLETLCRPAFGTHGHAHGPADLALVLAMWMAMALAMMLPTAAPMITAYSEIADTAARKGETVASPLVLTAGYLAIWFAFSLAATVLQFALTRLALLDPAMVSVSPLFSGAIFLGAAAYQFSTLKVACVTRCQRPFPFFLAHWSNDARQVFGLGARQGLFCVGCCWAVMLVMFAVGLMNVVWMAALGLVMAGEKIATTTRFSRAVGVVLGVIGAALIVSSIAAQWPVHAH
jgi:predicted metal-binding membrane protein